jgi:hypothetical protein
MFMKHSYAVLSALLASTWSIEAFMFRDLPHQKRQAPADVTDYQTITTPTGVTIRYKEPGKSGVCETTPGVNS